MLNLNFYLLFHLLILIIFLIMSIAFFTLAERKLMAHLQRRKGPDVVGFWGFLQPLADGFKLLFKEIIRPFKILNFLFFFSPIWIFFLSLINWVIVPFNPTFLYFSNVNLSIFFNFVFASLNVYGLILSGWSSNSRYSFLGGIRATAQLIAYELIFGMLNIIIIFFSHSLNYVDIVLTQQTCWNVFPLFPLFLFFLIIMLAETNRTPFDLAEAEAELVAGYNLEYSGIIFALFFLGEYANMLFLSVLGVIYFFGGWLFFGQINLFIFIVKILSFCFFFIWIRATLPRYRYDQLMELGWIQLLPLIFGLFFFYIGIFIYFDFYDINILSNFQLQLKQFLFNIK